MKPASFIAALLLLIATSACKPKVNDTSVYFNLPSDGWAYGDTLEIPLEMADSVATGDLAIGLRHTNLYLYSNLWLEVTVTDSLMSQTDTVNIIMATPGGRWLGCGIGTDFQLADTIRRGLTLHRPAKVTLRNIMRSERIEDIEQIGCTFTQTETTE